MKTEQTDEQLLEEISEIVNLLPGASSTACAKVMRGEPLTHGDGEALAALVRIRPSDKETQRQARAWLFDWLICRLEP